MKILYGIQGTGNGHITRARHLANAFASHPDLQVDYFFSGRKADSYFDMGIFGGYQTKRGLTFITENGRIQHLKTVMNNNVFSVLNDIKSVDLNSYDLLVNDFEPITAWAARKKGLPSISVSHQAAFLNTVPTKDQTVLDKMITRCFAPTTYNLGTHWYHFGHDIIPPFVAHDLIELSKHSSAQSDVNNKVLVYLPFESIDVIREQLLVLSDWDFICYHPSINNSSQEQNIEWHAPSIAKFKRDLAQCSGVLSNCGFELSTECLSLGKPLLVKPLDKQFEQQSNAYTLEQLGLCDVIYSLSAEQIDDWLQSKRGHQVIFPTDCTPFVDWLKQGNWSQTEKICQQLWQQVEFPNTVKNNLGRLFPINNYA